MLQKRSGMVQCAQVSIHLLRRYSTCYQYWTADRLSAEGGSGRLSGCIHRGGQVEGKLDNVQSVQCVQ